MAIGIAIGIVLVMGLIINRCVKKFSRVHPMIRDTETGKLKETNAFKALADKIRQKF